MLFFTRGSTSEIQFYFHPLPAYIRSGVHAYGDVSVKLAMANGLCQSCAVSPLLSSFVSEMTMEVSLSQWENSDFEYADDITLLREDSRKLQILLDHVNNSVGMFRTRFAPSKCKCCCMTTMAQSQLRGLSVFEDCRLLSIGRNDKRISWVTQRFTIR